MAKPTTTANPPFSVRLDPDTVLFVEALSQSTGLDRSGVIRLAIRDLAAARGVTLPTKVKR